MSDLQIALIIMGAILIAGVFTFNRYQEKKFNKYLDKSEYQNTDVNDPLFTSRNSQNGEGDEMDDSDRSLNDVGDVRHEKLSTSQIQNGGKLDICQLNERAGLYHPIDFVAILSLKVPSNSVEVTDFRESLKRIYDERINFYDEYQDIQGIDQNALGVETLGCGFQLIARGRAGETDTLQGFISDLSKYAGPIASTGIMSKLDDSINQAINLQDFVREVGAIIGISVIANAGHLFSAVKIKNLASSHGLEQRDIGGFAFVNQDKEILFSLDSFGGEQINNDNLRRVMVPGITFLIDVPVTKNGLEILDKVIELAKIFAENLGGNIVDDNRRQLDDEAFEKIKSNLRGIYSTMDDQKIPGGSKMARRIFY